MNQAISFKANQTNTNVISSFTNKMKAHFITAKSFIDVFRLDLNISLDEEDVKEIHNQLWN